jgi:hypothetical protein
VWEDGAPARPRSECWREAKFSACCAAAASSNNFSCWRTRRSSEVATSGQPRSSMAAAARFCDACRKSGSASHRHLRRRSRPRWRVGRCRMSPLTVAVAVLVHGRAAGRQLDGAHAGRRPPHGAPPAQGCLVQVIGRGARHPCPALGEEGQAPRRAGALPPRVRRATPAVGRRRRGGAESAAVRSCSMRRPRRRCIPVWDRAVAWFIPFESS